MQCSSISHSLNFYQDVTVNRALYMGRLFEEGKEEVHCGSNDICINFVKYVNCESLKSKGIAAVSPMPC